MVKRKLGNAMNEFIYTVTVIITVFLMTAKLVYPVLATLSIILCWVLISKEGKFRCPAIIIAFVGYGALILVQTIIEPSMYFSVERAVKELSRLCIYIVVVLIAANTYVREDRFLRLWRLIFFASVLVAILQFAKIESANKILIDIYGDSIFWDVSMKYSTLDLFRAGSIFGNANTYAKFILAVFAIFLAIDQRKTSNMVYATVSSLIVAASLLLAGSRTGVIIASLMVIGFYLRGAMSRGGRISLARLLMYTLLILGTSIGIAMYLDSGADGSGGARALQLAAGFGNSVAYKLDTFRNMVDQFTAMNMLIGMGPFETDVRYLTAIDFDLGYLVTFYGMAGCMFYVWMLCDLCRHRRHMPRRYSYFNRLLAFILVVFGLTGGTFLNLRIFTTFATMLYVGIVDGDFEPIHASLSQSVAPI